MPKAKKFGAFAGVFTPSILTILGVIMYLRLGWVVGQSGLIGTVAIILIAHIISITTGLSISSIATDKKIKGGGIYYILSRSLGLPMGGAIGITIFIGTSLSIALYLVGFAENFLGITAISTFLGLGTEAADIRIVGTAAILFLVLLAFISTSLAIKSQYLILGAIVLSLVSIMVGFLTQGDTSGQTMLMQPVRDSLPFETVFAIFFPAVTGFTAGVAMSGDLKDPKTAIPKGTLWAIGVGLVTYIGLAIVIAYFADRDALLTDYNFLMKVAMWSPLVVAGIWGATLSSALGGILGAPRILQAIARDKIFPRFFGKGYGDSNEPRNALLLTFLIAEAGILIGELDVIARVVSMFYIAAYGFINLAFALENWASTDFRPSFKIPNWIGIVGFVASFAVMFKLDTVAMILAIFIMFGIYFFLTKKELQVDFGDVWQSVWSSIVRSSLSRIARKGLEERNWQPNIILFSGGTHARPHLIEFGIHLVGRKGFLSNFDLVQIKNNEKVIPRQKQIEQESSELVNKGIFSRRHYCTDIYDGIRNIAGTYGFSGIEPNTVMMGWGRHSENPEHFLETVNYLKDLDMNILLMDYDKTAGFGKYSLIDIWWRTTEHNGNLALMLLKFLWLSDEWRNTRVRILIVNPVNEQREIIHRNTSAILENMRISAEIKIINNQIEQRSFYDIVQVESVNSDLILIGLPDIQKGDEKTFVEETNKLCKDIGTVLLLRASTNFKELKIGIRQALLSRIDNLEDQTNKEKESIIPLPQIKYPEREELAKQIRLLYGDMMEVNKYLKNQYLTKLTGYHNNMIDLVEEAISINLQNISDRVPYLKADQQHKAIAKFESNLLFRFRKIIADYDREIFEIQQSRLRESVEYFFREIDKIINNSPGKVNVILPEDTLDYGLVTSISERGFIFNHRLQKAITRRENASYTVKYKRIVNRYLYISSTRFVYELLEKWGISTLKFAVKGRSLFYKISAILFELEKKSADGITIEMIEERKKTIGQELSNLKKINQESAALLTEFSLAKINEIVRDFSSGLSRLNANHAFEDNSYDTQSVRKIRHVIQMIPDAWRKNQQLLNNSLTLELGLLSFTTKLRSILGDVAFETTQIFEQKFIAQEVEMRDKLTKFSKQLKGGAQLKFNPENFGELEQRESFQAFFNQLIEKTFRKLRLATSVLPQNIELLDAESLNNFSAKQYKYVKTVNISVAELMDYLLQSEFVEPLQKSVLEIPQKLEKINAAINEVIRNLTFGIEKETEESSSDAADTTNVINLVDEYIKQFNDEIDRTADVKLQIVNLFNERLNTFEDKLAFHSFVNNAINLKQYIRDIESRKRWYYLQSIRRNTRNFIQHQLNQFWYRQSVGVMFTQRLRKESKPGEFRVNDVINLTEKLSVHPETARKIPYYYSRLFYRKQYYLNEFWVGRTKELSEGERAIQRYNSGLLGGILVTGEANAGKSFFSQYFINKFYQDATVYNLPPPFGGSTDLKIFKQVLESTFEVEGSYYRIFNTLPENSVLIIDDLSLWWEKSEDGFAVVGQIMELINKYSRKCLFVVNSNKYSYELINRIANIEAYFINIIDLEPFNSEDLQRIVLTRHQSSGLKLKLAGSMRENLRPWDIARLFARYFSYSRGNAGVVLSSWLANIVDIEKNMITITPPKVPDMSALDHLKPDWYLLIVQLILHKRANLRKLSRICLASIQEMKGKIEILKRSRIIVEDQPGIYEINRVLYPHLQAKLIEKEML